MKNKTYKILGMGDSHFLPTGYSYIGRTLFQHLSNTPNKYECHYIGWNFYGRSIKNAMFEDGETLNYWHHSSGKHCWGKDVIQNYVNKIIPDLYFTVQDSFMMIEDGRGGPINHWINKINFPCKTIFYFPTDGDPFPLYCESVFKKFDYCVAMSKHGQKQVKKQFGIDVPYIPHFVDCNKFYKLSNKVELRKKWSNYSYNCEKKRVDYSKKRILLYVGRNQVRKMPQRLIKMFSLLCKDKKYDDTILLMKCDPRDAACGGVSLIDLSKSLNISTRVFFVHPSWHSGFTVSDMREVYNLGDVYVTSTSGEGWGLCSTEAMSCELPLVQPMYTAQTEQVDGDSKQLVGLTTCLTGTYNVERGLVDIKLFCERVKYLLDYPEECELIGRKNRLKCLTEYDTKIVLPKWTKFIEEVLSK